MPLLVTISFGGSIALIVYFLIEKLVVKRITYQWRRRLLICVGLCFLVPHQWWTWNMQLLFSPIYETQKKADETYDLVDSLIQITPSGIYAKNMTFYVFIVLGIIMGITFFANRLHRYQKVVYYFKTCEGVRYVEYNSKKNINICICEHVDTPFVIGIRRSFIVFPKKKWNQENFSLVLEHELAHVYQHDNVIKMIVYLIVLINFYNPFVYLFFWMWENITEIACDEIVLKDKSEEIRKQYAYLVIHTMENTQHDMLGALYFNKNKRMIKERISNMKKKKGTGIRWIEGVIYLLVICFFSSLSALAYDSKQVVFYDKKIDNMWEITDTEIAFYDSLANMKFEENFLTVVTENDETEFVPDDEIEVEKYAFCIHNYVATTINKHTKKSDGSCIIETYNGKKCTKCGQILQEDHISTISYTKCPHN